MTDEELAAVSAAVRENWHTSADEAEARFQRVLKRVAEMVVADPALMQLAVEERARLGWQGPRRKYAPGVTFEWLNEAVYEHLPEGTP